MATASSAGFSFACRRSACSRFSISDCSSGGSSMRLDMVNSSRRWARRLFECRFGGWDRNDETRRLFENSARRQLFKSRLEVFVDRRKLHQFIAERFDEWLLSLLHIVVIEGVGHPRLVRPREAADGALRERLLRSEHL